MALQTAEVDLLAGLLHAAELRHQVISHNVANVNTPGFQKMEVRFESLLADSMRRGGPQAAKKIAPQVQEVEGLPVRADGNNVDIDKEMGALTKNALMHQSYTQLLASRLSVMRTAITGRQ